MRKVEDHITLLDPQNVVDRLKGVAASIEAKEALVAQRRKQAAAVETEFEEAAEEKKKADEKLTNTDASDDAALREAKGAVDKADAALKKAEDKKNKAADALKRAEEDLKTAQEQNTVQDLAAAANDFSDLQMVPDLCKIPGQCENPTEIDCRLRK
jgi:DNA repair exonuclease SbcCD ATPase subunit